MDKILKDISFAIQELENIKREINDFYKQNQRYSGVICPK